MRRSFKGFGGSETRVLDLAIAEMVSDVGVFGSKRVECIIDRPFVTLSQSLGVTLLQTVRYVLDFEIVHCVSYNSLVYHTIRVARVDVSAVVEVSQRLLDLAEILVVPAKWHRVARHQLAVGIRRLAEPGLLRSYHLVVVRGRQTLAVSKFLAYLLPRTFLRWVDRFVVLPDGGLGVCRFASTRVVGLGYVEFASPQFAFDSLLPSLVGVC